MNDFTVQQRRRKVDPNESLSLVKPCALWSIDRRGSYDTPAIESPLNLDLMA